MKREMAVLSLGAVFLVCTSALFAVDRYVPIPYPTIQLAIDAAQPGEMVVLTFEGIYSGNGNRDLDFGGKAITLTSWNPYDPCVVAATVIDCQGTESEPHRGFYFHSNEDGNSVVWGLTITNGFGDLELIGAYETSVGGGIYCSGSSPTIRDCVITNNHAYTYDDSGLGFHTGGFGGGIYCYQSNASIEGCTIADNKVCLDDWSGFAFGVGGLGGGIYCKEGNPIISNCTITHNETEWLEYTEDWYPKGGGIYVYGGNANISDCTIRDNYSGHSGGGIYCWAPATIEDCDISNNESDGFGGGLSGGGGTTVSNCTISGNTTFIEGGGIDGSMVIANCVICQNTAWGSPDWMGIEVEAVGGGISCSGSSKIINCTVSGNAIDWGHTGGVYCSGSPSINNCIMWGNVGAEISNGSPEVTYSDVQGGWAGVGNIDADPCFADAMSGDYHLKSQAGRWDPNSESWVVDANTSLCIDAGNPGCLPGEEPDPNGNRINMGAYGGTAEASKSPENWALLADLTNDHKVDSNDLRVFVSYWLENGHCIPSDLNRDQSVDFVDFAIFALQQSETSAAEPGMTYQIGDCDWLAASSDSNEPRFSVWVEGRYINFQDLMVANCCPDELVLEMTVQDNLITIFEIEYTSSPCRCICDFPVTATLGPFDPGTYTLEVYQGDTFIGSTTVTIGPDQ